MNSSSARPWIGRIAPVSAVALLLAAAPAASSAAPSPTTPLLSAHWSVIHARCRTVTETVDVGRHHRAERSRVRRCSPHAYSTGSDAVRLAWHQHGRVRGQLTVGSNPVANATITITYAIRHHRTRTSTITTNAQGRYLFAIHGPSGQVTVSYETVSQTRRVYARGYLSLNVSQLRAGRQAHFSGRVAGGFMPQDLYIQFWYDAGHSGWQPFANLARVIRRTGRWAVTILIPRSTRGYRYRIHATVVASPYWPYAATTSPVISRLVR